MPNNSALPNLGHLVNAIATKLRKQKASLMVAESATGGFIQNTITELTGSSTFFLGGVVAYADALKERLLQVPARTLERDGAVSETTASAMALGVRLLLNADYGLATTGIAGPTGGSPDKPVGMVYVAVAHREFETITRHYTFTGSRTENKHRFTQAALQLLLDTIEE
jgi:PncC family amidohydrolase